MSKKDLPAMYSTVFWCLLLVLLFFWLYCVATVTPFIERRVTISTYTTGAKAEMTRELGSCTVKK